ncbi:MAG TPA: protein kinase [Gemmatimonadales bacterium]|nr:protein kinase [Gemmatimonadales bacterium]
MSEREAGSQELTSPDRMEELYERARAMDPETRAKFLAEACGGDPRLESELSSLLAHTEPAEAFFADLSEAIVSPAVGQCVGQYRLAGILGAGGMGTVYRAHDTRLDRAVALKVLPSYLSVQPEARERFLVEARAAAALEHPNVCSIHEIGNTADGRPFIAMACYEGETLKERLTRGPLPPAEAVGIAIQLARGLGAAHARGIVHRDVKPGNIMLCADSTVRLLDFGLAKVADVSLTGPGVTPGTVAYMSPEQARGDPVDHLTDLWSLGVALYEMLSGVRPFRGGNDRAVVQAILHEHPAPLPRTLPGAPPWLPRIVERLLRKAPEGRFRNAEELLGDLERSAPDGAIEAMAAWVRARPRSLAVSGAGLLAAVALVALVVRPVHRSAALTPPAGPTSRPPAIAVLPFTVRGPGLEVWREGMVDLLSMGLDGTAGIRAIDSRTLLARWHKEVGDKTVADLAMALGVARRSQARYALVGSAVAAGPRIRLGADVYDVESGRAVGPVQVDGPSDSVLALVDRLGMQTLALILEKDPGQVPVLDLARVTTTSLVALRAYLEGEGHYRRSEFREAGEAWERAVRADTLFGLAYLGLTEAYAWYDVGRYRENLERSRRMADRLPARERTLARAYWVAHSDAPESIPVIREVIREYPDAAEAWYALGEVYYHGAVAMSTPEEAEEPFRRAAELQPTMAPYRTHLLDLAFLWHPDSTRIARELDAFGRLAPEASQTRGGRTALALAFGDSGARAGARAELTTLNSESAAQVYWFLPHPRFAEVGEEVFSAIDPRLEQHDRNGVRELRFRTLGLGDGRVRDALAMLNDSRTPSYLRYGGAVYLSVRGLPVPERIIEQSLAAGLADKSLFSSRTSAVSAAGAAAQLGHWSEYSTLVSRVREIAARELTAGDSTSARYWDWAVRVAEAHGLWRRGRKEEALRAFTSTLPDDNGWFTLWNVGQLSLELGRLDQAERAFRALWRQDETPAYLQLARILERTGRPAEAREAYQFVAYAWRHADPELQPLVDEARQAVARLSRAGNQPGS